MRVLVPHTDLRGQVRTALDASGWRWEPVDVSSADTAYTRMLSTLWIVGETFTLVEHDVVIRPGVLDELNDCPHPWCAFPYALRDTTVAGLGCTKFTAELIAAHPHAVAQTWAEHTEAHPRGHWCNLDDRLTRVLTAARATRHLHGPPVEHLNPAPTHGCS